MTITVEGTLAEHAVKGTRGLRDAIVTFSVDGGGSFPFEVALLIGDTPEAHLRAERIANDSHRGMVCSAVASDIAYRSDHGTPAMVLRSLLKVRIGRLDLL